MTKFEGYPLVAVRDGSRINIYTNNAIVGKAHIYATTDTEQKALAIVNKVNFFDDILDALKDAHAIIDKDDVRLRIGNIIAKAEGK